MSVGVLPGFSIAAALLAIVIVAELATGRLSPRTTRQATEIAAPGPTAKPLDQLPAALATVLARPLFSPSRKPDASLATDDPRLPHLSGIVVTSQERKAIFAGRDGGHSAVVGPGDQVGAYRVQAITTTDVTLTGADGSHTVRPTFSPTSAAGPLAAPTALQLPQMQLPIPPIVPAGTLAAIPPNPNAPVLPGTGTLR